MPADCQLPHQVSLDYEDDGRSMSSETRQLVEVEVRKLVQVRVDWGVSDMRMLGCAIEGGWLCSRLCTESALAAVPPLVPPA